VLEEACSALKIADPGSVKLVVEKGEKHIDHSLTLRQANIKAATKLALVKSVSFSFLFARALQRWDWWEDRACGREGARMS